MAHLCEKIIKHVIFVYKLSRIFFWLFRFFLHVLDFFWLRCVDLLFFFPLEEVEQNAVDSDCNVTERDCD